MRITVTIDIDMEAYRAKYGPGTEWWAKYRVEYEIINGVYTHKTIPLPAEAYEFDRDPRLIHKMVKDCLQEGFYDWHNQGWLKLEVENKQ